MERKLLVMLVMAVAALAAMVLGIKIGSENYEQMVLYGVFGISIYFLIHGWKNVWWFVALLIFSGATFSHQFDFDSRHLFTLLIIVTTVIAFMHGHRRSARTAAFAQANSRFTTVLMGLLLAYGILHFVIYFAFPYSPTDYSWKSSTKAYFQAFAPVFCCFWLMSGSYSFRLKPNWSKSLIWIMVLCLIANIAVMAAMLSLGYQSADAHENDPRAYSLAVPVINLYPNVFQLRVLCPAATVLILMIATSPGWWRQAGIAMKFGVLLSIPLIAAGSVYSGGRATTMFCLMLGIAVAFIRKKIHFVALMGCIAAALFAVVNIFSHEINTKAPPMVARSVQMVMIEKDQKIYGSVTHSQDSRNEAFKAALVEWRKDNRVLLFGRSVFGLTKKDLLTVRYEGIDEFVENALRTGGTHNLVADLLLQYGLFGCTLYLVAYLALIRFFWRLSTTIPPTEPLAKSLADAMKIYLPLMFVYQLLGGTFLPMECALVVGLIRASLLQGESSVPVQSIAALRDRSAARLDAPGAPQALAGR